MPDWVPQVAPDFCPTCGVYWECEHGIITSTIEIPPGPTRRLSPEEFAKLDTGKFEPIEGRVGLLVTGFPPILGRTLDIEFAHFLQEARDKLISDGRIDLAQNIDMRIPDEAPNAP